MRVLLTLLLSVFFCSEAISNDNSTQQIKIHQENVLGTSLDISLYVEPAEAKKAERVLAQAVSHITQLENILSTYLSDSELNRLNHQTTLADPSTDLLAVLKHCEHWQTLSQGLFSCSLGTLKTLWKEADKTQIVPDRVEMRRLARIISRTDFFTQEKQSVQLGDEIRVDADGLAKGYIIDQVFTELKNQLPNASAIKVDIGGDGRYWRAKDKHPEWHVAIANPNKIADNHKGLSTLALTDMAIASSGHSSRFIKIAHRRFSHILDPREGWPLFDAPAAFVIAKDTVTADAVATALSTQSMVNSIDWVNKLDGVEALLISPQGLQLASRNWGQYSHQNDAVSASPFQLDIDYTIPKIKTNEYNKPYIAIWITDADGKPVRNLLLLGDSERWARENPRWWRKVGRRNADLLSGLARPTRKPGEYSLSWNGCTDFGECLKTGEYTLHIEAAREHGGHEYKKINLQLSQEPFEQSIAITGEEVGAVNLEYFPASKH